MREGSQRPLGGQPNKMMNMNINTYQEKKRAAEAKKAEQKKKTMEVVDEDRELTKTPESMNNGLQEIMNNNKFLDQIMTNDSRITKDKREQYQQDFEMKMEKMNYQLTKEFENA